MMNLNDITAAIRNGLFVSCHTDDGRDDALMLAYFVRAAGSGGAAGLRIEGIERIRDTRPSTDLPIVGFTHGSYADGSMLVTPSFEDIEALFDAGADVVAIDVTKRKRPDGSDGFIFFEQARKRFPGSLWADVANFREGVRASEIGADFVATTLSGHTPGTATNDYRTPDYVLISELAHSLTIPVIAEGRIWTPEDAARALQSGAHAVVVGSAIMRPKLITSMFVAALSEHDERGAG